MVRPVPCFPEGNMYSVDFYISRRNDNQTYLVESRFEVPSDGNVTQMRLMYDHFEDAYKVLVKSRHCSKWSKEERYEYRCLVVGRLSELLKDVDGLSSSECLDTPEEFCGEVEEIRDVKEEDAEIALMHLKACDEILGKSRDLLERRKGNLDAEYEEDEMRTIEQITEDISDLRKTNFTRFIELLNDHRINVRDWKYSVFKTQISVGECLKLIPLRQSFEKAFHLTFQRLNNERHRLTQLINRLPKAEISEEVIEEKEEVENMNVTSVSDNEFDTKTEQTNISLVDECQEVEMTADETNTIEPEQIPNGPCRPHQEACQRNMIQLPREEAILNNFISCC